MAREVELERIRRSTPKLQGPAKPAPPKKTNKDVSPKSLPNHLQRLMPKRIEANAKDGKEAVSIMLHFLYKEGFFNGFQNAQSIFSFTAQN